MRGLKVILYLLLAHTVQGQFIPPGTVRVDSIFIDVTEITNLNYLEYLHYLKLDSAKEYYIEALPDTTVWYKIYDDPLASAFTYDYFRGDEFKNFPIVGVTNQQAEAYCLWRSQAVNQKLDSLPFKLRYHLPSPKEWYSIALSSSSYQVTRDLVDLSKMKFPRSDLLEIRTKSTTDLSIPKLRRELIGFYERNSILLFENLSTNEEFEFKGYLGIGAGPKRSLSGKIINNIRGNISELTSEPNIAMGGNWTLTYEETPPEVQFIYEEPSALIGFRCLCEVLAK